MFIMENFKCIQSVKASCISYSASTVVSVVFYPLLPTSPTLNYFEQIPNIMFLTFKFLILGNKAFFYFYNLNTVYYNNYKSAIQLVFRLY